MEFTERQLRGYSKPISDTEEQKCKNAISMISKALKEMGYSEDEEIQLAYNNTYAYETRLRKGSTEIKLLVQGSYANNTNVRTESDVDIAVIQEDVFHTQYREGVSNANYGFATSDYSFREYKNNIYQLLVAHFGNENIVWKNKYLFVNGNTYRVDADTVPARRNKNYKKDFQNNNQNYIGGISITPDTGEKIINYPEQHIKNGRDKNQETNSFYKKMVRIIKRMRYLMVDHGITAANKVNSFLLESLLWNIPNYKYTGDSQYLEKFQGIINYIKYIAFDEFDKYKEANGIKELCETKEKEQNLKGFIIELDKIYEY